MVKHRPVKQLPIIQINGRNYYRDDRLKEYRAVDNPHDRLKRYIVWQNVLYSIEVPAPSAEAAIERVRGIDNDRWHQRTGNLEAEEAWEG